MFASTAVKSFLRVRPSSRIYSTAAARPPRIVPYTAFQPEMSPAATRPPRGNGRPKTKKQRLAEAAKTVEGSHEEILGFEITKLLKEHRAAENDTNGAVETAQELPQPWTEVELDILEQSSTGDGLALLPGSNQVYVVPFSVPGDTVIAKVIRHHRDTGHSDTDFIKVVKPSPKRDDSRIKCQYFAKCGGCQFQMLSYEDQLAHKKNIVEKAYQNFSGLVPSLVPAIGDTIGSPKQYGYRTKLTPHFDVNKNQTEVAPIGFMIKGTRKTMDIEECPLGTEAVNLGVARERRRVHKQWGSYKRAATLICRESTQRIPKAGHEKSEAEIHLRDLDRDAKTPPPEDREDVVRTEFPNYIEEKTCITNSNAETTEYVDDYKFTNRAGAFFQNNNSILSPFTEFIRSHALGPPSASESESTPSTSSSKPIKYLLDAYSGSGLFTVTLSPLFSSSLGVDIAAQSITAARTNAKLNNLPNTGFIAATASDLFADIPYPADQTLLVIDPPRKGCDENFMNQMLAFGPKRVVYVSCNVHTQARDIGWLVPKTGVSKDGKSKFRYEIESVRGFDFFPQTGHVEGVAILNRVEIVDEEGKE